MSAELSVIILTYNEEINLEDCLRSVVDWAGEVYVVDSFSTDRTPQIAKSFGAEVVQHEFSNPAQQKNWALTNLPLKYEWLLFLDADERVPPALRDEIIATVENDGDGRDGFRMRYRLIFYGKWIRHCGWYPVWIMRLVRRSKAYWEDRPVDEHIVLDGKAGHLANDLIHENLRDMEFWIAKHNRYSNQNASIYYRLLRNNAVGGVRPRLIGNQAERKRFIKERVWPRLPGRALIYFFYLYVFRLGFLDGRHGLMFCVMHSVFQQFISAKLWEMKYYKEGARAGAINVDEPLRPAVTEERGLDG